MAGVGLAARPGAGCAGAAREVRIASKWYYLGVLCTSRQRQFAAVYGKLDDSGFIPQVRLFDDVM